MKLEIYLLRELCVSVAFAVGGMFVLALPGVAVSAVHRLAGVDTRSILFFLPLLLAGLVPYILPIGYLLALVVTYGRLAADHEWTAIRAAGVHPFVILKPACLLAVLLSGLTLWLVSEKLPEIRRSEREYIGKVLRGKITNLSPGLTELHVGKFYLSAGYRDGPDFLEAFIYVPGEGGEEARSFLAERVHFQFTERDMLVYLRNARSVVGDLDVQLGDPVIRLNLDEIDPGSLNRFRAMRYRSSSELAIDLAGGAFDDEPERRRLVIYEIHGRRAISSTYFMFLVLGVPTGLLLRRGTQLAALSVAVGYALVYYLLSMRLGKFMVDYALAPPIVGAWTTNAIGFVAGLLLTRKALRQ